MKTKKYYIQVDTIDIDNIMTMEITKKEFDRQLKFLQEQVTNTADAEYPMETLPTKIINYETSTAKVYYFTIATTTTYLTIHQTKEGYHFTK